MEERGNQMPGSIFVMLLRMGLIFVTALFERRP